MRRDGRGRRRGSSSGTCARDHPHARRLADDAGPWRSSRRRSRRRATWRADAADLLVVGEGQVHRLAQRGAASAGTGPGTSRGSPSCRRCRARRAGRRGSRGRRGRWTSPGRRPAPRRYARTARCRRRWPVGGREGGEQVGLGAVRVGMRCAARRRAGEVGLDKVDEREVGVAARRVERHQALDPGQGRGLVREGHHDPTIAPTADQRPRALTSHDVGAAALSPRWAPASPVRRQRGVRCRDRTGAPPKRAAVTDVIFANGRVFDGLQYHRDGAVGVRGRTSTPSAPSTRSATRCRPGEAGSRRSTPGAAW